MELEIKKQSSSSAQTLVVFVSKGDKPKDLAPKSKALLEKSYAEETFSGDKRETILYRAGGDNGENVIFVGLGPAKNVDAEMIRCTGAIAYNAVKAAKATSAALSLDSLTKVVKDAEVVTQALAEGLLLTAYEFNDYKSKPKEKKDAEKKEKKELKSIELVSKTPNSGMTKGLKTAEILAECQNFARRLGDTPSNFKTPAVLANEAVKAAKATKSGNLKVTVWDMARLKKENMGGLVAVGKGSEEDPRFIIMEYNGAGGKKPPVCFVGKGLTFDTGGISIKPAGQMEEMKYDMCGGAAVIATMLACAKLKLKVNVLGLVAAAENMPDGKAIKPGDVYYARNGKTVEVFNTDAEGRLVLGEALVYGSEQKPVAIFDAATLTGAIIIALGNTHTGVFTRDKKLMKRIQDAADASGELVWSLPLTDWHVEDMKGTHADLCNISAGRNAGSSTAAAFLEQFVGEGIPWAHFDIAGTAWNVNSRFPYHPRKGGSGIIMRTFVELAKSY
jgi:leucyl aminopeptidase